ncbi:MAG TPA: DinB family protein [Gemmatimonadaceae bacterium]|nr:DinB family protein [Gemmatimonadaceae bacterium]
MIVPASLIPEFDTEMKSTRRVIERVPAEKGEWRPHPKSFPLGHLAQLLAWMPGWITNAVRETRLDLTKAGGYSFEKTDTLLDLFDRNVNEAREALGGATVEDFAVMWSLTMGDRVLIAMPRADVVRQTISHLSHHRGQMTVYLRLLDIPVPCIYGPTADEKW